MIWTPVLVTAPLVEPVSLSLAKSHLRIDDTASDTTVAILISTALSQAQNHTRKKFITQTWDFYADCFPDWEINLAKFGGGPFSTVDNAGTTIASSITHIKYNDTAGTLTTLAAAAYREDRVKGRITPAFGYNWPVVREESNAVVVRVVLGISHTAAGLLALAPTIVQGMLLRIGTLNEFREEVLAGTIVSELKDKAESLWDAEHSGWGKVG